MRSKTRVSMIGSGAMLQRCVEIAGKTPEVVVDRIFIKEGVGNSERHSANFLAGRNIKCITYKSLSDAVSVLLKDGLSQDLLVSVYNYDQLEPDLLSRFAYAINFHDSPLPRYAGRNAVSWALLGGESEHGVAWHEVVPTFDAGDIIGRESFTIDPKWTALDLAINAVDVGCRLFADLLRQVTRGTLSPKAQDLTNRTYFNRKLVPYGGRFPFMSSTEKLERLRRATAYFPMPNPFCLPAITIDTLTIKLVRFSVHPGAVNELPGTIIDCDPAGITFATFDGVMKAELVQISGGTATRSAHPAVTGMLKVGSRAVMDSANYDSMGLPLGVVALKAPPTPDIRKQLHD